jgi:hypothetical protein
VTDGEPQAHRANVPNTARLTPYEMVFGEAGFENRVFPTLLDESEAVGEDPASRERFAFLSLAADALRDIIPADAPREALEQHRALLYHSFNFWRFGRRLYLLERAVTRYLVEAAPSLDGWDLRLPHPSIYIQLPGNLFWASISPDTPPEPVDGFFAVESRGLDPLGPPYRHLEVLLVLGIRRERAGFSIIPLDLEVGPGIADDWAAPSRDDGPDFVSVLPGGDMAGIYSILTTGEALKLLARILWYVDMHEEDVVPEHPRERRTHDRPGSVALSRLSFSRIRFGPGATSPSDEEGEAVAEPVDSEPVDVGGAGSHDSEDTVDPAGPADPADPAEGDARRGGSGA